MRYYSHNRLYTGCELLLGTVLNYVIIGSTANASLLFLGLFSAFCAIICMAVADAFSQLHPVSRETFPSVVFNPLGGDAGLVLVEGIGKTQEIPTEKKPTKTHFWVFLCLAAGTLCGFWSPLSSIGRAGTSGVSNSYACYFLYTSGELLAVPFILFYYGRFVEQAESSINVCAYLTKVYYLPKVDKLYGVLAGVCMGNLLFTQSTSSSSSFLPTALYWIHARWSAGRRPRLCSLFHIIQWSPSHDSRVCHRFDMNFISALFIHSS
jgi:hypothetical protein